MRRRGTAKKGKGRPGGTGWRAAAAMMAARLRVANMSAFTTNPPFAPAASQAKACSTPAMSSTGVGISCTLIDLAAASNGCRKYDPLPGAVVGLNKKTTRMTDGVSSLRISTHLPPIEASILVKPVTLPPGRAKLVTMPSPTGSDTVANTIGMLRVACNTSIVAGVLLTKIASGAVATSSTAKNIVPLAPAALRQPLPQCRHAAPRLRIGLSGTTNQRTDPRHSLGLLRACRERPCCRAAENRDER